MAALALTALLAGACSDESGETTTGSVGSSPDVITASTPPSPDADDDDADTDAAQATEDPGIPATDGSGDDDGSAGEATSSSADDEPGSTEAPDPGAGAGTDWRTIAYSMVPMAVVSQPMVLIPHPTTGDLWVAERAGRVRRLSITADGDRESLTVDPTPILDITDRVTTRGEGGLLGMALSPDGADLYAHYTDLDGNSQIVAFPASASGVIDPGTEQVLLSIRQPFSNHNGADVAVGPDGYLYITMGDGGSGDDPEGHGQNPATLLGSVLRIDPRPGDGSYQVPAANPFVGDPAAQPEVLYWGLRNPFRISFDPETGDLWIPDVGQNQFEEINVVAAADRDRPLNFGWAIVEGFEVSGAEPADHVLPILAYGHSDNRCSITGGHVYRGADIASLDGVFLYSDYCRGGLNGVIRAADGSVVEAILATDRSPINVIGFGRDGDGEIYALEQGGAILRLTTADQADTLVAASGA